MTLYAALILYSPHLYPLDDHEFLRTIQVGKSLPFYVDPAIGRFYPLTAQEFALLSKIDPSPALYFAFNALQFVVVGWALIRIMGNSGQSAARCAPWLFVLFSLSPGFVSAWFRFQVSERGALFFFVLFLVCYLGALHRPNAWWFAGAVATANIALYYKEPGILILGVFAVLRLASQWRTRQRVTVWLDLGLFTSCAMFLVTYISVVYLHKHGVDYADFHKALFHEVLVRYVVNDPLLLIGAVPLAVLRLVCIGRGRRVWDPVYDPALLASVVYIAFYPSLGIFSLWYLVPAYGFALPAMLRFAAAEGARLRWAAVVPVVVQLVAGLPLGLYLIAYHKGLPEAYTAAVDFLTTELARTPHGLRAGIFPVNVNRGTGVEVYYSLVANLKFKGLEPEHFDLKSDLPIDNQLIFRSFKSALAEYSAYRDEAVDRPRRGDYLLVTPWAPLAQEDQERLAQRFDPVFRAEGSLRVPDVSLAGPVRALILEGVDGFLRELRRPAWHGTDFIVYAVQCDVLSAVRPIAPLSDFAQTITLRLNPVMRDLRPGQRVQLALWVSNPGTEQWPVAEAITTGRWVHLSYRWMNEDGAQVAEGPRQVLPCSLRPKEVAATRLAVKAPRRPGRYRLRITLVQEEVAWFDQQGGHPLDLEFEVVR